MTLCKILYIVLGTYVQEILNPSGTRRWTSKLQRSCSVNSLELAERQTLNCSGFCVLVMAEMGDSSCLEVPWGKFLEERKGHKLKIHL